MCKHCVKCQSFAWWDGDFCCIARMSIIECAPDGKFWAPFPEAFNANKCEDYIERENYNTEVHNYYGQYINFLEEYYELPNIEDKEAILKDLGYKTINEKVIRIN